MTTGSLTAHGRRNGFESGTAKGVEHEPPEAANRDMSKASTGFPPHQQGGLGGNFFRNPCANCILERKLLLKLLGQIQINISFITTPVRLTLIIVHNYLFFSQGD